jgi:dienelactone hydrolase
MKPNFLFALIMIPLAASFGFGINPPAVRPVWTLASKTAVGAQLQETFWTTELPPIAKHMKVGLRRLFKKNGTTRKGVVVYLPPSATTAHLYTENEKYDFRIFLANRGYDLFSVEYRNSFVTAEADISDLAKFTTSLTLSDIQQAIAYVKKLTGVKKVFLIGHSSGARFVYLYACARWGEDLKGMIPMDGSPWESAGPSAEGTMDISLGYAALAKGDTPANRALFKSWGLEPGPQYYDVVISRFAAPFNAAVDRYYSEGPTAKSPVAGFPTVSDYIADQFYRVWGERQLTNVLNGFAKVGPLLDFALKAGATHWPLVDYMEDDYLGNWNGNPPVAKLRFAKNIGKINIPILVFASTEWTDALGFQYRWKKEGCEMINSYDRQFVLLNGFGHLDVLVGEYAKERVFIPLYNWLQARKGAGN